MAAARTATAEKPTAETKQPPREAPQANPPATAEQQQVHPLKKLETQLNARFEELRTALPAHMPPERFIRVVLTAVQNNPRLLGCDRQSLWNSCLRAAQDGLLPDGQEGAIVEFKDKSGKVLAQWMPMYRGILKKVRNSGQFVWATAQVVRGSDRFRHWVDEKGEHVEHEPAGDESPVIKVYAVVTTKAGGAFVEVMTVNDVKKVQNVSKAKSDYGPWAKWWDEMAKKTVFRRLSKRLPMSSDLDDLIRRDDALYDLEATAEEIAPAAQQRRIASVSHAFDHFAGTDTPKNDPAAEEPTGEGEAEQPGGEHDGEFEDGAEAARSEPDPKLAKPGKPAKEKAADKPATEAKAGEAGGEPDGQGDSGEEEEWPADRAPKNVDEYQAYVRTKAAASKDPDALAAWFKGEGERKLRNACGLVKEEYDTAFDIVKNRIAALRQ